MNTFCIYNAFPKYLLSSSHVPSTILGSSDATVKMTDMVSLARRKLMYVEDTKRITILTKENI